MKQLGLLIVVGLTVAAGSARADPLDALAAPLEARLTNLDGWVSLSRAHDGIYYIRPPRGADDVNAGRFWMRTEYYVPLVITEGSFKSSLSLIETRCATFEYRITEMTVFHKEGMVDGLNEPMPNAIWSHAPPGSVIESAEQIVCDTLSKAAH